MLQLLNTGNLVLINRTIGSSLQSIAWQSFDYPTDTLLPGMKLVNDVNAGVEKFLTSWNDYDDPSSGDVILKIEHQGLSSLVLYKGSKKVYRSGTWNGIYFSGTMPFPIKHFNPEMVFEKERMISLSMLFDKSIVIRVIVTESGFGRHLILNSRTSKWHVLISNPEEPCSHYGICGPFGICTTGVLIKCQCLKGYAPKNQDDWDVQDWSGGCTRVAPLNCTSKTYGFLEVTGVKYPDMLQFLLKSNISIQECRALCLENCSCRAYANPYINGSNACLMWFGDLIDTAYLSALHTKQKLYLRVLNSELGSKVGLVGGGKNWPVKLILIAIVSGVLVSCLINGGVHYLARQLKQDTIAKDLDVPLYKLSTIMAATNNFSKEKLIGEGGFGFVYRGTLSPGVEIAVKRLSKTSGQGVAEFKAEVMLISKLQHRNLVKLLGCCTEREERILIYEYMLNKSLDTFVFDQTRKTILTWPKRFNIIIGIAKGLLYLHHDSRFKIIHRDLKTSNILLDGNLNPKISDFGLARTFEEDQSTARTKRVVGTNGYMSPEYVIAGRFSMKSDIFSLGVVFLEIVSGKRNKSFVQSHEYNSLLEYAWLLWKENKTLELMDECLSDSFVESQVIRCVCIGLLCVQMYVEDRPDMISICSMLATEEPIPFDPKEPGFSIKRNSKSVRSCISTCGKSENGTLSITDIEAR